MTDEELKNWKPTDRYLDGCRELAVSDGWSPERARAMLTYVVRLREENRRLVEASRALLDFWADHETGPMSGVDADELTELECGLRAAIEGSK